MAKLNNQRVYNFVEILQGRTHFVWQFPAPFCVISKGLVQVLVLLAQMFLRNHLATAKIWNHFNPSKLWRKNENLVEKCFRSCAVHRFYSTIVNLVADPKESASSFKLHHRFFFIFNGLVSGQIYSFYPWMGINCDSISGRPKIVLLVIHANPRAWKYQCFLDIMPHICWLHAHIGLKIAMLSNATK